jgi:hypothetical protein
MDEFVRRREALRERDRSLPVVWIECVYYDQCGYKELKSAYVIVHLIQHHNMTEEEAVNALYEAMMAATT